MPKHSRKTPSTSNAAARPSLSGAKAGSPSTPPAARPAPLLKHRNWRFLLRDLTASHRGLQSVSSSRLQYLLMPAASAAWWLLTVRPDLLERTRLSLLVPGPGVQEVADSGRWWNFVPWLVGRPELQFDVTLVGDQLIGVDDSGVRSSMGLSAERLAEETRSPAYEAVKALPAGRIVNGLLKDWYTSNPAMPDACVVFAPGFESHHAAWLADDGLLPLMRAGVPLGCFSYSRMDRLSDWYVLGCYGLRPQESLVSKNPWLEEEHITETHGGFAQWAWALQAESIPDHLSCDEERLRRLAEAARYLRKDYIRVGDAVLEAVGRRMRLQSGSEAAEDYVYLLPDGLAVEASTGEVLALSEDGLDPLDPELFIDESLIANWPEGEDAHLERVIRAVELHRDHVAPRLSVPGLAEFAEKLGLEATPELEEMVRRFQNQDARPSRPATAGSAAFFTAIEDGDIAAADELRKQAPELLQATDGQGKTGVMHLYDDDQHDLLRQWVEAGALLNVTDTENHGLLHDVIRRNDASMVVFLAEHGQDLNLRVGAGFTPATLCLSFSAWDCLAALLERGADITSKSLVGRSLAGEFEDSDMPEPLKARIRERLNQGAPNRAADS